ncbi:biotin--[acetyl-CoA-carboxylase] ligase [Chloroflexota bacterium]
MEANISPASIIDNLETHFIGRRIIYYPSLTSTMEVAKREAQQGAAEGTVIITDEQTAGRGRIKRVWLSPKGSIALSVILYPGMAYLSSLVMLASLAVMHSIEAVTGLKPQLKWPNDVLLKGRKVCGILIESKVQSGTVDYAVIGIGVNVNLRLDDFPDIQLTATSLSHEVGREVSRINIIQSLLVEIERLYSILSAGGSMYEEWRESLVTLGKSVRVKSGEITYEGIAESVTSDGSLLLRDLYGNLSTIVAGDVTLRD